MNVQQVCTHANRQRIALICLVGITVSVNQATKRITTNVMTSTNAIMACIAAIPRHLVSIMMAISNVYAIIQRIRSKLMSTHAVWVSWGFIRFRIRIRIAITPFTFRIILILSIIGCMFEDMEIPDGERVSPHNQPCKICTCNRGVITCEEPVCNCSTWKKGSGRDLCCPQCDPKESCLHQELKHIVFRSGEQWIYQCQTCECLVSYAIQIIECMGMRPVIIVQPEVNAIIIVFQCEVLSRMVSTLAGMDWCMSDRTQK